MSRHRDLRLGLIVQSLIVPWLTLCLGAPALAANLDQEAVFEISAQPLETALLRFSEQSGVQVQMASIDVPEWQVSGLSGRMVASKALAVLLERTGLSYQVVGGNTVAIYRGRGAGSARKLRVETLLASNGAVTLSTPAGLGATAESSSGLEEIIVTAEKREQSLQDTPISIVALTSDALETKGISGIDDLRAEVPSLQIVPHPNSASTAQVFIRGVGSYDDQFTQDPSVAVYVDGVYIGRSQGLSAEVADLQRIEVLRGPQGSLYGRNATGGAINYITRAPELGELSARQSVAFGNYDQIRTRTHVNVPVGDELALEFAFTHSEKNGFVRNLGTGVSRYGDRRRDAYRAALRWVPSDAVDIRYTYDRSEIEDTPGFLAHIPAFYPADPVRPSQGSVAERGLPRNKAIVQGHNLTASFQPIDGLTLKSITGYRELDAANIQHYLSGVVGPFTLIVTDFDQYQKQLSQELQAIGDAIDGRLQYVLGAYYLDESADSFDRAVFGIPTVPTTARIVTANNKAYAMYGQATYRPAALQKLYVTPSVRWSRDQRQATLAQTILPRIGAPIVQPPGSGDKSGSNVSPGLVVGYDVMDDVNLYARYSRGYKTGGFNVRASTIARFNEGFNEETIDAFELGMKSSWLGNRLRVNVAGFYSDYQDVQINVQVDPNNFRLTDVLNAGKATIQGVELDVVARPTRGLMAGLSYAWLDAGYEEILDPFGRDVTSRYNFVEAPEHTVTGSLQYEFPATPIGTLTAQAEYFYQSKKNVSVAEASYVIRSYGLLDARLVLSEIPLSGGNWRVSVFGKNLTDEEYLVFHGNASLPVGLFGDPRSYGIELSFEY